MPESLREYSATISRYTLPHEVPVIERGLCVVTSLESLMRRFTAFEQASRVKLFFLIETPKAYNFRFAIQFFVETWNQTAK